MKANIKDKYLFYHTLIVSTISPTEFNLFSVHSNRLHCGEVQRRKKEQF